MKKTDNANWFDFFKKNPSKLRLKAYLISLAVVNGFLIIFVKHLLNLSLYWTIPLFILIEGSLAFLLYKYIYSKFQISLLQNLFDGITMVIIFLGSYFLLGESYTIYKIIGIIFILIGVILL
jgi:drug/metabolite transporter (DMT)-like permease